MGRGCAPKPMKTRVPGGADTLESTGKTLCFHQNPCPAARPRNNLVCSCLSGDYGAKLRTPADSERQPKLAAPLECVFDRVSKRSIE